MGLESGSAACDLDFMNGFGLRSSRACYMAMRRFPGLAPLLRPFHALYRAPAPVFVGDGRGNILWCHANTTGPRQGCILGSISFCASVQQLYLDSLKQSPGTRAVAVIDNFTLIGPVAALEPAARHVLQHASDDGGRLRRSKCKVHCSAEQAPQADWARSLGFRVSTNTEKYLGGFIGGTLQQKQAAAMKLAEEVAALLRKLEDPNIPVQIALLTAFSCIPDRFSYLARLNTPEVLRSAARYLDNQLLSFYCNRTGIAEAELTPAMRGQLYTPRKLGGRGLRSCEALLERAYLGSLALAAPRLQPLLAQERAGSARERATAEALAAVKSTVSRELAEELLPDQPSQLIQHFAVADKERRKQARELQQSLTQGAQLQADERRAEELKAGTVKERALRNANRAPGASLVFTTVPSKPQLALSNSDMAFNERLHLGLPPERHMPLHCACGHANGQYGFDPLHGLSCVLDKGRSITQRHDDVKYELARWVTAVGGRVRVEPRADGSHGQGRRRGWRRRGGGRVEADAAPALVEGEGKAQDGKQQQRAARKRFDLLITGLGKPIAVDVRVAHPLAPSLVERCAADAEGVLEEAEAEKDREYRGLADQMGASFFAFAVETTGRLGQQALAFIRLIIQEAARYKSVWAPKEVVHGIYRSVAMAVARGNANVVQSNLLRSRLAEW
jgi:hypothetical protein